MTAIPDTNEQTDTTGSATRRPLRDGVDATRSQAHHLADAARTRAGKVLDQAKGSLDRTRETLGDAYTSGREKATEVYSAAREKAKAASKSTADGLDTNPIAAVIGGLAIGAVVGALLPRTEREARTLGAAGSKINDAAREAAGAARDAGKAKLAELGLSPEKARESIHSLIDGALSAATSAGSAAVEKARARPGASPGKTTL